MGSLANTILAGTGQMADAAAGLAQVRAKNRERQRVAMQAASESLADVGKTIKDFGSYQEARKAEMEIRDIRSGLALGRATKGNQGVLIAARGYRPLTKAGADALDEGTTEAAKLLQGENRVALETAQAHHLSMLDQAAQDKQSQAEADRAERETILAKYPLPADATPEDTQEHELYSGGLIPTKDHLSYREQRRKEREFAAKEASKVAMETAKEAGRKQRAEASEKTKREIAAQNAANRLEIVKSQLEAGKTNAENAIAARTRSDAMRNSWEEQRVGILQNEQTRKWMAMKLQSKLKQLTLDRITALASGWNSDEDKDELLKAIDDEKESVDGIMRDIDTYERAAPKPVVAPAQAAPVVQPHQMSDDDLDAAIKAAEKAAEGGGK